MEALGEVKEGHGFHQKPGVKGDRKFVERIREHLYAQENLLPFVSKFIHI